MRESKLKVLFAFLGDHETIQITAPDGRSVVVTYDGQNILMTANEFSALLVATNETPAEAAERLINEATR